MPKNAPQKQKMPKNAPNQLFLHDAIPSISEEVKSIIVLVFAIYFKDVKISPNLGPTCNLNLAVPLTLECGSFGTGGLSGGGTDRCLKTTNYINL